MTTPRILDALLEVPFSPVGELGFSLASVRCVYLHVGYFTLGRVDALGGLAAYHGGDGMVELRPILTFKRNNSVLAEFPRAPHQLIGLCVARSFGLAQY